MQSVGQQNFTGLAVDPPPIGIRPADLPAAAVPGLYVHIPFCFHKCHYCDFYSITRQTPQRMQRFVDLLLAEADLWASHNARPTLRPRTIFFGGGTPTLLPLADMARLIDGLDQRFDLSACAEWTIEANPATIDPEYCAMLVAHGVNRLSMGAQSFDASELAALERHHDPEDVPRGIEIARSAGLRRLNVDLIYAIPGQTLQSWMRSLESAIQLNTEHISCYGLTYEPNTPLAVRRRLGQLRAADEDLELQMLADTRRRLTDKGLPPYEISNYARPGAECQHNLLYWNGGQYIGLGPSAASHVAGWRWKNRPHLGQWENAIEAADLPALDVEHLAPQQRAGELAMLLLRLSRGLNFADFTAASGFDAKALFAEVIERMGRQKLLDVTQASIKLTDLGLPVADSVAAEFLHAAAGAGAASDR
jgi:oxygen-independent coproporphyrinogen-3 oxidase